MTIGQRQAKAAGPRDDEVHDRPGHRETARLAREAPDDLGAPPDFLQRPFQEVRRAQPGVSTIRTASSSAGANSHSTDGGSTSVGRGRSQGSPRSWGIRRSWLIDLPGIPTCQERAVELSSALSTCAHTAEFRETSRGRTRSRWPTGATVGPRTAMNVRLATATTARRRALGWRPRGPLVRHRAG